ncbi:MAG: hypothetical protein ACRDS0_03400 [Pseudonocardiaceae bacterium]
MIGIVQAGEADRERWRVFGDVLPEGTADDRPDPVDAADAQDRDRWLQDNRPPHHDTPW